MKGLVAFLLVVIILLVGGLAYFAGRSGILQLPKITISPTSEESAAPSATPETSPGVQTKTVTGGGMLSFPKWAVSVPSDWTETRESLGPDSERVTVKKDGYEFSILQGGFGGSICLYPGDADSEGPSARYTSFIEITSASGDLFRRSWTTPGGFAICHKTEYGWNIPTMFGAIGFKVPAGYSVDGLAQMDAILASLTRR